MTVRGRILLGLGTVVVIQIAMAAGLLIGRGQGGAGPVATFDPERGLALFVVWSRDRFDDEGFTMVLPAFQDRVTQALHDYSAAEGVVVVRANAVLSGAAAATADITDEIMNRVLVDGAF